MHLVGHIVRHRDPAEAEKLYRASLSIGQEIGNHHHEGQVMHSLANLIGRGNPKGAEKVYRQSLQILQQMDDRHGQAQVMHSLANLIGRGNPHRKQRISIGRAYRSYSRWMIGTVRLR